jgi:hypothetical protein
MDDYVIDRVNSLAVEITLSGVCQPHEQSWIGGASLRKQLWGNEQEIDRPKHDALLP